jgi:hypothetical protein
MLAASIPAKPLADSRSAGRIVADAKAVPITLDADVDPGIRRPAATCPRTSPVSPASAPPSQRKDDAASDIVIVGGAGHSVAGHSVVLDWLRRTLETTSGPLRGKEGLDHDVVFYAVNGVERGRRRWSDKRGAIYKVYDVSEAMGVLPRCWWADVPFTTRMLSSRRRPLRVRHRRSHTAVEKLLSRSIVPGR